MVGTDPWWVWVWVWAQTPMGIPMQGPSLTQPACTIVYIECNPAPRGSSFELYLSFCSSQLSPALFLSPQSPYTSKVTNHLLCLTASVQICLCLIKSANVSQSTALHERKLAVNADHKDCADTHRHAQTLADCKLL